MPPDLVRSQINTTLAHVALVADGVGVGFQPCYIADNDPRLRQVAPRVDFGLVLWLLAHKDMKRTARVRALLRFLGDALNGERDRFLGGAEVPET